MSVKISIVTAVFNAEHTVAQAIASVAGQSFRDVEHLVIEGMSRDGSLAAIRRAQHDRMVVISEPDQGIYDALNKGIMRATGDVVGLVHADDYLAHQGVLAKIGDAFADPAVEAVYGDLDYVAKGDGSSVVRRWHSGQYDPRKLARGWMPPHPTLYLRRHVFDRIGLFDTGFGIAADYDFVLRYFSRTHAIPTYIPEILVKMRVGGASNHSIKKIIQKTREDYYALRKNNIGGVAALVNKNLSKISQFF